MARFVYIDTYSKKGKLAISEDVFATLVANSLSHIEGISESKKKLKKNQYFLLNRPVQTNIRRGIVHIKVVVDVAKGKDIQEVSLHIQQEIYRTLMITTEQVPLDIIVKVESIV